MKFKLNKPTNHLIIVVLFALIILFLVKPAYSIEIQSAASTLNAEAKDINNLTEVQKIEKLLDDLETYWNEHNSDKVLSLYADDFVNGDGLSKDSVKELTKELWDAYPDIRTTPQERQVRVYGDYATAYSTDSYLGTSKAVREEVGAKGTLTAVATGEVFLKKYGPAWKITSDRTIFEKVSIGYGLGEEIIKKNKIMISAPEQVASGKPYTTALEFNLPEDIKSVASINKELLVYPQLVSEDKFRLVDKGELERLFTANKISKNELVTATVGLTGGAIQPTLLGLVFLSQRVNVIPVSEDVDEISIIKEPARSALNKAKVPLDCINEDSVKQSDEDTEKIKDEKNNQPDADN